MKNEQPRVRLSAELYQKIQEQATSGLPNEICGYVSSGDRVFQENEFLPEINVTGIHLLRNVDENPEHYSFDPKEQFEVFKQVASTGKKLIGTYHSHPSTPSRMSDEDIRLAMDEKMIYGIYAVEDKVLNFFTVKNDSDGKRQVRTLITEIVN